ncbi:MAG: PIN domain-containing protein [Acidobacteriota bacterium]
MATLIDADVLIEAERGRLDLMAWLSARSDEEFKLAAITVAELWHGVERASGQQRVQRANYLERIFALFEIVPYTETTAMLHARLWAELAARGQLIGAHDLILAATALAEGAFVATFNARHLAQVPGLRILSPI